MATRAERERIERYTADPHTLFLEFENLLRSDPGEVVALAEHVAAHIHGPQWPEEQLLIRIRRISESTTDPATIASALGISTHRVSQLARKHGIRLVTPEQWITGEVPV